MIESPTIKILQELGSVEFCVEAMEAACKCIDNRTEVPLMSMEVFCWLRVYGEGSAAVLPELLSPVCACGCDPVMMIEPFRLPALAHHQVPAVSFVK